MGLLDLLDESHRARLRAALLELKQMTDDGLLDDTDFKEKKTLRRPTPLRAAQMAGCESECQRESSRKAVLAPG